jgi:hypothetical protein
MRNMSPTEITACAMAAHEVNRVWQRTLGEVVDPPWDDLTRGAMANARDAVYRVADGADAAANHEAWCQRMASLEWRRGEHKSILNRTHPALVPWAELPSEIQAKDHLFVATIKSMLDALWRLPQ